MKLSRNKLFLSMNVLFAALIAVGCALYLLYGGIWIKSAASALFVLCAAFNLAVSLKGRAAGYPPCKFLLFSGLFLSFVGDVVLELHFIAGIAVFAAGHLLLIAAFHTLKPLGWRDILSFLCVTAFSLCMLLLFPAYRFGDLLAPVLVYAVVISAMLGKAAGVLFDRRIPLPARLTVFCGALLFFLSDFFLTLGSFTEIAFDFSVPCLVTYYLAVFLLALSVALVSFAGKKREKVQMNVFGRLWCRAFQAVFRAAIPLMPYRDPVLIEDCGKAAELVKKKGKTRVLVVTDAGVRAHGLLNPLLGGLEAQGVAYEIFDETPANPTVSAVERAFALYRERKCDALAAVGGGSAMDCAKGVCARVIAPKKSLVEMRGILKVMGKQPLFIALPTTAGTGSEATIAAVLTDEETHRKFTVLSFCLMPKYAVLDPMLTKSLPPAPTAETGLDALTHAVEAYIGRSATRRTRRLAEHAVSLIKENLPAAYRDGNDLAARKNMQLAAYEAGIAFTVSYVGYVHAVAHSLGGAYNAPHGRTNATLLPVVLKIYGDSCARRLARLARSSGVADPSLSDMGASEAFIAWIESLNEEMNIPKKVRVEAKDIPKLAQMADSEANPLYPVPRLMNAGELEKIYLAARETPVLPAEKRLEKQREYFESGLTLPVKRRKEWLKKLYAAIKTHEEEIFGALKSDLGKSGYESYMCEVGMTRSEISFMLRRLGRYSREKRVRTPLAQFASRSYIKPSPYGCVLIMSPWNYPFMLTMEPLVDALAAGNCATIKPSAYSPATGAVIKKIVEEVFPPELVAVVLGGRKENSALLDLPFDKIFFTGSVAVGKEVLRHAAEKLIPVTLELGGKSPCIVDASADIPLAAKRIVFGKFLNCGQTCVAPDYVLAHESVKEKLLAALKKEITAQYGDPLFNPDYGKMISQKHFDRVCALIDGEKVVCGGRTNAATLQIEPTVLADVTREDAVMGEEIFGPVLPVLTYQNDEEIIADIRAGGEPLALYLFTSKRSAIKKFTSRVAFGGGCVNDVVIHLATSAMGFGGVGKSGMGSYHGKAGFDCFTHKKSIVNKRTWIDMPMRYRPYKKFFERLVRLFMR